MASVGMAMAFSIPSFCISTLDIASGQQQMVDIGIQGTVGTYAGWAIDPNLHQFTARALYPNVNHLLLPGRYASVLIKKDEIENAIAIPTEAIVPGNG